MESLDEQTIAHVLADFAIGDRAAIKSFIPRVYSELRRLAAVHLRAHRVDHTLQPTALVHEAYIRLAEDSTTIVDRRHFFRLVSKLMRQILVDHARVKRARKRGGDFARRTLLDPTGLQVTNAVDLLDLEEALLKLENLNPRYVRLIELRFYGGLDEEQAAEALGISRTQAARDWRMIRAWLADEFSAESST